MRPTQALRLVALLLRVSHSAKPLRLEFIGLSLLLAFTPISTATAETSACSTIRLAFLTQPSGATAGSNFATQPVVVIQDIEGNTVTSATDLVTVSITSNTGAAGATLDGTLTVSAINGMATFTDLGIDAAGSSYTLTAYKDILAVAVSSPFSVSPVVVTEPPTLRLRLSPPTEPTTVSLTWDSNDPLSEIAGYKIQAVYQDNNPEASITGYNELDSTPFSMDPFQSQANSLSDNVTSYTLDVGNVTSYTLSGLNEGTTYDFTVSAYDSDGNEFLFSTDAPASLPTTLAFLTQPSGAMPGSSFATQPMVVIQDIEGNIVTSATDLVTVSITSNTGAAGATLDGTLTVSAINGMATFMDLGIDAVGSGYTLTADSGSLPLAVSSPFNVLPVVVTELTFAEGTGDYVNVPLTNDMGNVTIKMYWDKDENGVDFWTSEAEIFGYKAHYDTDDAWPPYTNSVDVGNVTSYNISCSNECKPRYYMVVSAYDSEGTDIGTVTSYTLVIPTTSTPTPVPAACSWGLGALAFTTQPVGAGPGEVFTPQPVVAIQDNFGNTVTGATGAVTLSITPGTDTEGATLSGTTTVNAVNGVATFTNLSVDPLVSYYSLTATSPDYTSATSWTLSMTAFGAAPAIGQVGLWVLFGTFSVLFIVLLMRRQGHINEREAR